MPGVHAKISHLTSYLREGQAEWALSRYVLPHLILRGWLYDSIRKAFEVSKLVI